MPEPHGCNETKSKKAPPQTIFNVVLSKKPTYAIFVFFKKTLQERSIGVYRDKLLMSLLKWIILTLLYVSA